ncbi:hypothetical protein JCM15764A_29900 [Geotalea toluenoxydans]
MKCYETLLYSQGFVCGTAAGVAAVSANSMKQGFRRAGLTPCCQAIKKQGRWAKKQPVPGKRIENVEKNVD